MAIIRAISQEAEREVERNEQVGGGRAYLNYKENQVAVGRGRESGTAWNLEWWRG